jgi:hypothetical protein
MKGLTLATRVNFRRRSNSIIDSVYHRHSLWMVCENDGAVGCGDRYFKRSELPATVNEHRNWNAPNSDTTNTTATLYRLSHKQLGSIGTATRTVQFRWGKYFLFSTAFQSQPPGAHTSSCKKSTGYLSPKLKQLGRGDNHPPPQSNVVVNE